MKIYKEMSLRYFEPWGGAVETYEKIFNSGKIDEFEAALIDAYQREDFGDTELNDLLWFEPDFCLELVGLKADEDEEDADGEGE